MEPIIKTRFPTAPETTSEQVFTIMAEWVAKNRNFRNALRDPEVLENLVKEPDYAVQEDRNNFIEKVTAEDSGLIYSSLNLNHSGVDSNELWRTRMSFKASFGANQGEIAISTEHGSLVWNHRNIRPNKPGFVNMLLKGLPRAYDGWMPIWIEAHPLQNEDEIFLADFINGTTSENFLPIVYVSRTNQDRKPIVDPDALAKKVAGLAHVVVEPTPSFSRRLRPMLSSPELICYDGGIRVYWPKTTDPRANKLWIKDFFQERTGLSRRQVDIPSTVIDYLASKTRGLTPNDCSHDRIVSMKRGLMINERLQRIKAETESREENWEAQMASNKEMGELYEETIKDLEKDKISLESEKAYSDARIERLSDENAIVKDDLELARMNMRGVQNYGGLQIDEGDVCTGEALLAVEQFLKIRGDGLSPCMRQKLEKRLEDHREALEQTRSHNEEALTRISNAFTGYSRMNSSLKTILNKYGFDCEEKGKHYHIVKMGFNPDIFVTLSKTTDKPRSGKNFAGDMKKTFYDV
jgi:hypothetical protein